ncbi:MAG: epimerase [Myxococcota bacterium]
MRVLVIGGNRFLGVELTARLLARGDAVTLLNRGSLADPFGALVERLRADRGTDAFDAAVAGRTWDAVVDFALFDGAQARRLGRTLAGRVAHVIAISTGQVYLVREPRPALAIESDYDGPVLPAPPTPRDEEDWRYGIEKRDAEDELRRSGLPHTLFRIPMVHGGRDHKRRIDSILWRLMDRGPILLTRPEAPVRHVFSGAVVEAILAALARGPTDRAWNLSWDESMTARAFVEAVARTFGVEPNLRVVPTATLLAAGLEPTLACSVNSEWMSTIDASLARRELGFVHPPLASWLPQAVHATVARWTEPPPSMAQRPHELALP